MAVGLSALLTRLVLRLGLGTSALSWARGTVRGWHTSGPQVLRFITRQLAREAFDLGASKLPIKTRFIERNELGGE